MNMGTGGRGPDNRAGGQGPDKSNSLQFAYMGLIALFWSIKKFSIWKTSDLDY